MLIETQIVLNQLSHQTAFIPSPSVRDPLFVVWFFVIQQILHFRFEFGDPRPPEIQNVLNHLCDVNHVASPVSQRILRTDVWHNEPKINHRILGHVIPFEISMNEPLVMESLHRFNQPREPDIKTSIAIRIAHTLHGNCSKETALLDSACNWYSFRNKPS